MSHSREAILEKTRHILTELFEIDSSDLNEDALMYEDLDIDSIDTVDLLIELKRFTGKDIPPQAFGESKTLGDIVSVIAEY
ncbi:MAG: acyl carrier protein [Arenicella sp.]